MVATFFEIAVLREPAAMLYAPPAPELKVLRELADKPRGEETPKALALKVTHGGAER